MGDKGGYNIAGYRINNQSGEPLWKTETKKQPKQQKWQRFRQKYLKTRIDYGDWHDKDHSWWVCKVCNKYCDRYEIEIDHIIPRSLAPHRVFDETNLQLLCSRCHRIKHNQERK